MWQKLLFLNIENLVTAITGTLLMEDKEANLQIDSSTIVVLMCENIFSERIIRVWSSLPPSIVSFESFSRSEILWVMPTSVYVYQILIVVFLLSLYLVFNLRLMLCVLLLYAFLLTMWHVSGAARPLSR